MARIAVDMDEVIADALSEYLGRYNADFGAAICKDDLCGKRMADVVPAEHWPHLEAYFDDESFFRNLAVIENSQEVLEELSAHHEIFIVTAAMEVPCSLAPKYEWLRRHFSFIPADNYVFCGNKGVIAADYLIDDSVYQLERFRGEGILFTSPRNRHVTKFRRVNDWREVHELFLAEPMAGQRR